MATSRPSDSNGAASNDPARPSDHIDQDAPAVESSGDGIVQPRLGVVGYLRFFWRQLTSMRTALFLLLLLAIAAIPGSLVPQRTSDPNGVLQFQQNDVVNVKTKAAFGQVGYIPVERVELTAGIRYTDEHKDYNYVRLNRAGTAPAASVGSLNGLRSDYDGNHTDYRLAAQYRWNDDVKFDGDPVCSVLNSAWPILPSGEVSRNSSTAPNASR